MLGNVSKLTVSVSKPVCTGFPVSGQLVRISGIRTALIWKHRDSEIFCREPFPGSIAWVWSWAYRRGAYQGRTIARDAARQSPGSGVKGNDRYRTARARVSKKRQRRAGRRTTYARPQARTS